MADELIDKAVKTILSKRENGKHLEPNVVAHYDYFINTLNFKYKMEAENPFKCPENYPALLYKPQS